MKGFISLRFSAMAVLALVLLPRAGLAGDEAACADAGADVERRQQLPSGLLLAIGEVESGRRDPASGHVAPWPWTINAAANGRWFDDRSSAVASTQALRAEGVASIDVGCFQINLAAHPDAFEGLEQAFNPAANADYAGRLLVSLKARLGSWREAIAAYHSATPERGGPYRDLVLAAWGHPSWSDTPTGFASAPMKGSLVRTISWSSIPGIHVWTPSGSDSANVITLLPTPSLPQVHTPGH